MILNKMWMTGLYIIYYISTKMVKRLKHNIMLINDSDSEGYSTAVGQH